MYQVQSVCFNRTAQCVVAVWSLHVLHVSASRNMQYKWIGDATLSVGVNACVCVCPNHVMARVEERPGKLQPTLEKSLPKN